METKKLRFEFIPDPEIASAEIKPIIHNKNSRRHKTILSREEYIEKKLTWQFSRYKCEENAMGMDWVNQSPVSELSDIIIAENLIEDLNTENLFNLKYFPQENDCLSIKFEYSNQQIKNKIRPYINEYILLVFKDEKWIFDNTHEMAGKIHETIKTGIIKYTLLNPDQ